jgi:hypothetical protein
MCTNKRQSKNSMKGEHNHRARFAAFRVVSLYIYEVIAHLIRIRRLDRTKGIIIGAKLSATLAVKWDTHPEDALFKRNRKARQVKAKRTDQERLNARK